jgi:hypothetical protein
MSLFVPAPNCVVTTFLMEIDGVAVAVMPSFRIQAGSINIFNLTTFNTAMANAFKANVLPLLSSDLTYLLTQSRRQNNISDIAASNSVGSGTPGEEGVALPSGVCVRMEINTGVPGRGARGAIYQPGIPRSKVTLNTVDTFYLDDLKNAWIAVQSAASSAGWYMVVRSKFVGNTPRPVALLHDWVSFEFADFDVDYQRRRKPDAGISDGEDISEQLFLA